MTRRLRSWLADLLIPPLKFGVCGGPAFFAYSQHTHLMDPLAADCLQDLRTYVLIGDASDINAGPNRVIIPRRLRWHELLFSLFFWRRGDIADLRFLFRLYGAPELCISMRGGRLHEFALFRRVHALRTFVLARYFALKFRHVAQMCDAVHVVVYYNAIMLGVVRAFSRLGKPTWDVQHGHIGETHGAYSNAKAYQLDSKFKPSGFVVWDRRFGEYVEATLGAEWRSTNYRHLVRADRGGSQSGAPVILYSLQWATPVPPCIETAVRRLGESVRWIFRLHPFERSSREDLGWVRELENAAVCDASEPLASALMQCDMHITYNSSVVHEAAALGVRSLFLDPMLKDRVRHETGSGLAGFVSDSELIPEIERQLLNRRPLKTPGEQFGERSERDYMDARDR